MADTSTVVPSESLLSELDEANRSLETAPRARSSPGRTSDFAPDLVLACSFQDIVLVDLAVAVDPGIEVIFLDTEAHFPETLEFVDRVSARYGLNLTVTHPGPEAAAVPCGTDGCCQVRKVAPLRRAVAGRAAWLTALKRVDAPPARRHRSSPTTRPSDWSRSIRWPRGPTTTSTAMSLTTISRCTP